MIKLLCARSWGKLLMILKIKLSFSPLHDSGRKGETSPVREKPTSCVTDLILWVQGQKQRWAP